MNEKKNSVIDVLIHMSSMLGTASKRRVVVGMFRIWLKYMPVNPKDLDTKFVYKQ